MNKLFTEFENESILRVYPFASGCTVKDTEGNGIGTGVLVDAALYPVNATGPLYLSGIQPDGIVNISDSTGIVMTANFTPGDTSLEFYDHSGLNRHVGTIIASSAEALSSFATVYEERKFKKPETLFSSSCVFPIVNDGVTSLNVGKTGPVDGEVTFTNLPTEDVRVASDGQTLRFDVIPDIKRLVPNSIKHIYCIVDGQTPFRIQKVPFGYNTEDPLPLGNTVALYLDNIDRDDICGNKHREDALVMTDVCEECASSSCPEYYPPVEIPYVYQTEVVDIPNGSENAFYLTVPNFVGYNNPLSLTMLDGLPAPKLEIKIAEPTDSLDAFTDELTSKGVILQVPGLDK